MLFFSFLAAYLIFPSLIIYKPVTFIPWYNGHDRLAIASLGVVNVGSFLIFEAIGSFIPMFCSNDDPEKK